MNLPSAGFSIDDPPMPWAAPVPAPQVSHIRSSSPTAPRALAERSDPTPTARGAPRRSPSRRVSIRRELPPAPGIADVSPTTSALVSPPRVRLDAQTLSDQHNGLLSPPRSRNETYAFAPVLSPSSIPPQQPLSASGPAPSRISSSSTRLGLSPPQSNRSSSQRALPPAPVYATPSVATSNMVPNLPVQRLVAPQMTAVVDVPRPLAEKSPTEKLSVWIYSPEETALMKAVSSSAEARVRDPLSSSSTCVAVVLSVIGH